MTKLHHRAMLTTGLTLAALLAGCGGGGSSNDNTGPTVSALTSTCQAIIPSGNMVAIAAKGGVGSATLDVNMTTLALTITASTLNNEKPIFSQVLMATSATGSCSFKANTSSGPRVLLANKDLGVAYRQDTQEPVLLLGNVSTSIASMAGTYNMVRYQQDTAANNTTSTRTSYATFVVNTNGSWSLYKNAGVSDTATASGTLELDGTTQRLLLVTGSGGTRVERGSVFLSGSGSARILAVAEHDPGDAEGSTSGLFIGVPQAAWSTFSSSVAGTYVTNTTDPSGSSIAVSGLTLTPSGSAAITATADSPIQGLLTALSTNYVLLRSGLLALISNETNGATTSGYLELGVIPQP